MRRSRPLLRRFHRVIEISTKYFRALVVKDGPVAASILGLQPSGGPILTEMSIPERVAIQEQVERILQSDALHGSEVLRRLLKFLADKSVAGESNNLKEYSIATDGLGKHFSYDPCHSSAVRLQVRRLREKLADYYRDEGLKDPVVIDLPKGRFKLRFEYRPFAVTVPSQIEVPLQPVLGAEMQTPPSIPHGTVRSLIGRLPRLAFSLGAVLTVALAIGEYQQFKIGRAH